jgi:transposase
VGTRVTAETALSPALELLERAPSDEARQFGAAVLEAVRPGVDELFHRYLNLLQRVRRPFGRSAENMAAGPGQLAMAFLSAMSHATAQSDARTPGVAAETPEAASPTADATQNPEVQGKPEQGRLTRPERRRNQRNRRPTLNEASLPQVLACRDLPHEETCCAVCGKQRALIGFDEQRQIKFIPQRAYLLRELIATYGQCCAQGGVVKASPSPKPIPGSLVSAELLAYIVVTSLLDMPLHRLDGHLARGGLELGDKRLGEWRLQAGDMVSKLSAHARQCVRASSLISFDDTVTRLQLGRRTDDDARRPCTRGHLWLYLGNVSEWAWCEVSRDWKGEHPLRLLDGFTGTVQKDGYAGINPLRKQPSGPLFGGCHDHSRRRYFDAFSAGDTRAWEPLRLFQSIYQLDAHSRTLRDLDERRSYRSEIIRPIWDELDRHITALIPTVPPREPLGRANTYWTRQRSDLMTYFLDPAVPLSTAHVERLLRWVALMRKTSLFLGPSDEAHRAYANLMTIIFNCMLAGANPYQYFVWLFGTLPHGTNHDIPSLLPQVWVANQPIQQPQPGAELDGVVVLSSGLHLPPP